MDDLRGILLVSRLIMLVEFGLPIGPKQTMLGWFSRGMITLLLRFWGRKAEIRGANKKSDEE